MSDSHFLSLVKSSIKEERRKRREKRETQKYFYVSKVVKSIRESIIRGLERANALYPQQLLSPLLPQTPDRNPKKLSFPMWGRKIQTGAYE